MCIGSSPPSPPRNVQAEAQQKSQSAEQFSEKAEMRDESIAKRVAGIRGGVGRRSLITGSSGGAGYRY